MKTTFDIAGNILENSRALARREKIPLKELVEEGLCLVLERHSRTEPYQVKPVTFNGNGLNSEYSDATWAQVRNAVYEGHGA